MTAAVIKALEAAIENSPDDVSLREHVAGLLRDDERFEDAWDHAVAGLRNAPAHARLLAIAAEAGEKIGAPEAPGYAQLHAALTGTAVAPPESPTPMPPWHQLSKPANDGSEMDEFLREEPAQHGDEVVRLSANDAVPDSLDELLDIWDDSEAAPEPAIGQLSRDRLLLSDVGGMDDVKQRLQTSFLNPMRNPEMQAAFGKSMRGGLLLWGPPGCGKTFIAKAVAGELDANFYSIGLSDVLDMYIGSSERNITAIFETARRNAPCVLFLDEVDAIGQKRTHLRGGGGAMRGVVNQLLQEMDGADSANEGVFVLAATNHPWDVDSALLRPGRFDRSLLVLPPDASARRAILELHLRNRPTDKLDLEKCARSTEGLSGADLALVAEQATELAMEASIEKGEIEAITMRHLAQAIKTTKPSYEPWVDAARNFATFNNESGTYDDLLVWLQRRKRR